MTDEQKKMIEKLNEDNRKLVTIIIVLFFVQHNT